MKIIVEALLYYLVEKPELYFNEIAWFLWDEFGVTVLVLTISRVLLNIGWLKKTVRGLISNWFMLLIIYRLRRSLLLKTPSFMPSINIRFVTSITYSLYLLTSLEQIDGLDSRRQPNYFKELHLSSGKL